MGGAMNHYLREVAIYRYGVEWVIEIEPDDGYSPTTVTITDARVYDDDKWESETFATDDPITIEPIEWAIKHGHEGLLCEAAQEVGPEEYL